MALRTILCLCFVKVIHVALAASRGVGRHRGYVVCLNADEDGSLPSASNLARHWGFKNHGEVISGTGCYHFYMDKNKARKAKEIVKRLSNDPRIKTVVKQSNNIRQKRGFMPLYDPQIAADLKQLGARDFHSNNNPWKDEGPSNTVKHLEASKGPLLTRRKRGFFSAYKSDPVRAPLSDPYWKHMWYLNREGNLNMNVQGAWDQGISGKGVAVTILDDGIEKDHPDLIKNYDPLASTDINDNDSDPSPRYDFSDSNRHGTRCAGQVGSCHLLFCTLQGTYHNVVN